MARPAAQRSPNRGRPGWTQVSPRWYGPTTIPTSQRPLAASIASPLGAPGAVSHAAALATHLLRRLDSRIDHSAAVAAQVDRAARLVEPEWRSHLKDAAWLHDIGYSPQLALTGFHPLDGARWLRDYGWPASTCRLVAWHTEPLEEARLYSLDSELAAEFEAPPRLASAALAWADLTSSPAGERWDAERRLADILERYPPSRSCTRPHSHRCRRCARRYGRSRTCSVISPEPGPATRDEALTDRHPELGKWAALRLGRARRPRGTCRCGNLRCRDDGVPTAPDREGHGRRAASQLPHRRRRCISAMEQARAGVSALCS